jgi:hypothetical protein
MTQKRIIKEFFELVVNTSNLVQYNRLMKKLKSTNRPITTHHPIIQMIQLFNRLPNVDNYGFKHLLQFLVYKLKAMKYDQSRASRCFLFCMQTNQNAFRKLCLLMSFKELND